MAKVSFTKLGLSKDKLNEVTNIIFNEQTIGVKQYLPINEKLEIISRIVQKSMDDMKFFNPVKLETYLGLEILYNYTNINFTDKIKEDEAKLFDLVASNKLLETVRAAIPQDELNDLIEYTWECADAITRYHNSALGIVNSLSNDYSNTQFNLEALVKDIKDPEVLSTLKDIIPLMSNVELEDNV